jgi:hypothetical protein
MLLFINGKLLGPFLAGKYRDQRRIGLMNIRNTFTTAAMVAAMSAAQPSPSVADLINPFDAALAL